MQLTTKEKYGKKYFLDERLIQARNVENPHEYINFGGVMDMGLYFMAGTRCGDCGDTGIAGLSGATCVCPSIFRIDALCEGDLWLIECETTIPELLESNGEDEAVSGVIIPELEKLAVGGEYLWDGGAGGISRFIRVR